MDTGLIRQTGEAGDQTSDHYTTAAPMTYFDSKCVEQPLHQPIKYSVCTDKVNVLKFQTLHFLLTNKMLVIIIRTGIHKTLVRIANREDPDQTASSALFV